MDEQARQAFGAFRRHLGEAIGVDKADAFADEIVTKTYINERFAVFEERMNARFAETNARMDRLSWRTVALVTLVATILRFTP